MIMRHEVEGKMPDGSVIKHDVDMTLYGESDGGYTGMAKGVGYPCAVATRMVLMGKFSS